MEELLSLRVTKQSLITAIENCVEKSYLSKLSFLYRQSHCDGDKLHEGKDRINL